MSQSIELDPVLVQPLRRPERRPAARPRTRPDAPKVRPVVYKTAMAIIVAGVVVAFAGQIAAVAMEPIVATYRTGREIQRLQGVLAAEQATNAQLRADIAYLGTNAGVEQEARRRGWVLPGEVALTVVTPQGKLAGGAPADGDGDTAKTRRTVAGRVRDAVDTTLAVLGQRPGKKADTP